jgi:hypothetical protein
VDRYAFILLVRVNLEEEIGNEKVPDIMLYVAYYDLSTDRRIDR